MKRLPLFFPVLILLFFSFIACEDEKMDTPDPIDNSGNKEGIQLDDLGTADLPVISIFTNGQAIPNEPKVPADYSIKQNNNTIATGRIGIELRGSTSRRLFEKKSYGLETWDSNNKDLDVALLGFPEEEDWILYGPYADKTLLRNILMYDLSNQIGVYAARTQFVEVMLNETYMGVYVFMEKLKRDNDRIDIKRLEMTDMDAESITGGYILKIDKTSGDNDNDDWGGDAIYTEDMSFRSDYDTNGEALSFAPFGGKQGQETYFLYEYPDVDDITNQQRDYIKKYIDDFEDALLSDDFSNGMERTYTDYISVKSFTRFFILNELAANPDAYRISTFLYKDRDKKLRMGPIWDFNIALGMDGRSQPNQWIYQYNERVPNDTWLVHFWWTRLLEDPLFRTEIKTQWQNYRANELSNANINATIEDRLELLEQNNAIDRNFERWDVLGVGLPFNSFVGKDYEEELAYLKDWLEDRVAWMDSEIGRW
ncbi:MAG: CotH kinase family protein [Bacteroidota bacterium]